MTETIGTRISRFRKAKGLTQEELASRLGVSAQAVSKWENDISCPDIGLLPQLSRILGVTTDEILTGRSDGVKMVPPGERRNVEDLTLRIRVNSSDGESVKISIPMPLVKICMEKGMDISGSANAVKNLDIQKILQMVEHGVTGKLVEVTSSDGDVVEVFVE